jgi:hypothetical protein
MLINPQDGNYKLHMSNIPMSKFLEIFEEGEKTSLELGFEWDWRCLVNYIVAHYKGEFQGQTFYLDSSLTKL